jgi:hypothetical protein
MSAPVDVLVADLRRICGHDSRSVDACVTCEAADRIEDDYRRRAAVAELIEADHELDAARQALWESGGLDGAGRAAALNREIDAKDRRATALANATGAP